MRQADWEKIARRYDVWLPHFKAVTQSMQAVLHIEPGMQCLDVASGTGEPALSFASEHPEADFLLTDQAEQMLEFCQFRAQQMSLNNIRCQVLSALELDQLASTFDVISCRFGLMLMTDQVAVLDIVHKLSKPGTQWCFTVWSDEANALPSMEWVWEACLDMIPASELPPLALARSLGNEAIIRDVFGSVAYNNLSVDSKSFNLKLASFEDYWQLLCQSGVMDVQLAQLNSAQKEKLYERLKQRAESCLVSGTLILPHRYWQIHVVI